MLATEEALAGSALAWYVAAAIVLIALNAFYVAYEFAILAAKRSTFLSAPRADKRSSTAALASMSDLSMQLAGAQLGITMATLALGYVGEPAFEAMFEAALGSTLSPDITRGISIAASLSIVVFLHLVLGEMVPKNLALAAPDATLRWLVLPYGVFLFLFRPFIVVLNGMANIGCRVIGVQPRDELVAVHSASELAAIVTHSRALGSIEHHDADLLSGALHFAQTQVGEVATPVAEVKALGQGATAADAEDLAAETSLERLPITGTDSEWPLIGYVHARDLFALDADQRLLPLPPDLIRTMAIVESDRSLVEVLEALRRAKRQLALVTANGRTVGIISVEEVVRALLEPATVD